jgi:hypothetical protein
MAKKKSTKDDPSEKRSGAGSKSKEKKREAEYPPAKLLPQLLAAGLEAEYLPATEAEALRQLPEPVPEVDYPPAPKSGIVPKRQAALRAEAMAALALPQLPQPARGQAINLGPIAGTGSSTGAIGAGATDLCEIAPSGQVALAGDTFAGNKAFVGAWSPSMGLHVKPGTLNGTIQFDRSFGQFGSLYAEPPPNVRGGSQLPAGTVGVFGTDYALVTRTRDLIPIDSRLVRINPNAAGWPTVPGSWRDAGWEGGNQTQISGCQAPDGWVYIVAGGFARNHTVRLYRVREQNFEDRNMWSAWGFKNGAWQWHVEPSPLSADRFGEMSLRLIDGMFVLSGFNQSTGRTEVRVTPIVEHVLAPWTPVTVVATQQTVFQNYGGYIVPGSTLDQAIILVSQWVTAHNTPYNVQQFVVNLNR